MKAFRRAVEDEANTLAVVTVETAVVHEVTKLGRMVQSGVAVCSLETPARFAREADGLFLRGVREQRQNLRAKGRTRKEVEKNPGARDLVEALRVLY